MKTTLKNLLLCLASIYSFSCASQTKYKISELSRKNAVLTESYGILNQDDIDIYAWIWSYDRFHNSAGIEYWTCHPAASVAKLTCRDFGYDSDQKEHNAELEIDIHDRGKVHEITGRRAIDIVACKKIVADIRNLLKGESHFCAGLIYNHEDKDEAGRPRFSWVYDKFKTKRGCVSYFQGYCEPSYWKRFGYPIAPYGSPEYPHP